MGTTALSVEIPQERPQAHWLKSKYFEFFEEFDAGSKFGLGLLDENLQIFVVLKMMAKLT